MRLDTVAVEVHGVGQAIVRGTMACYVPDPGEQHGIRRYSELLRQQAHDCIAALEILRVHGYAKGLAAGKFSRYLMEHFGVYVARCTSCEVYQSKSHYREWPQKGYPTFLTRLSCKDCYRKRLSAQPARQCRSYTIVGYSATQGPRHMETRAYAARNPREAAGFFFSRANGYDPQWLDVKAETYHGVPYTVTLSKQRKPRDLPGIPQQQDAAL